MKLLVMRNTETSSYGPIVFIIVTTQVANLKSGYSQNGVLTFHEHKKPGSVNSQIWSLIPGWLLHLP